MATPPSPPPARPDARLHAETGAHGARLHGEPGARDARLHAETVGHPRPHGETGRYGASVVLAHGFTQTGQLWGPMAEDLARDHTVVRSTCPATAVRRTCGPISAPVHSC